MEREKDLVMEMEQVKTIWAGMDKIWECLFVFPVMASVLVMVLAERFKQA